MILAPHLITKTKKELGLPHWDNATDRQRHDGMCWKQAAECYNGGSAFKVTCRDATGVIVTIIADNYYGYCKKEVKTQISYAANLMGNAEEEHAGGALAFASYSLGDDFQVNSRRYNGRSFDAVAEDYSSFIDVQPEGYGIDRSDPTVIYIPDEAYATLERAVHQVDQGWDGATNPAFSEERLHLAEWLQDSARKASGGTVMAVDRHGRRGRFLPQTMHG